HLELPAHTAELAPAVVDVDGDADRLRLVGDRSLTGLADPPRRVRGELEALAPVELLRGTVEADHAFLAQVAERHVVPDVPARHVDDEPQVRVDHALLRPEVAAL